MKPSLLQQPTEAMPNDWADEAELGAAAIHVLSSPDFPALPVDRQIAWILHCFQTAVMRSLAELEIIRSFLHYHALRLYKAPDLSLANACVLTESIHGLNWADAPSLFDMRGYDRHAVQPFRNYVRARSPAVTGDRRPIDETKRLTVAYFCHYADSTRGNALGPMIRDIVINHARHGKAKVLCYCVQWCDQAFADSLMEHGIHIRVIPQELQFDRLEELRAVFREDQVDVAISDVASPIASWLFIHRVAPLQMYLDPGYPHWNLPELDWVLLPGKIRQKGFELPDSRWSTIRLDLSDESVGLSAAGAVMKKNINGSVRLGVFTRLIKITDVWLSAVESILSRLPEATLLIVGPGNPEFVQRLVNHPIYRGRVGLINEMVELRRYQDQIDIFLDTFPFIGGMVCREMMGYGIPVVSLMAGEWDEFLRETRDPVLLSGSVDEYIELTVRLANNPVFFNQASENSMSISTRQNDPSRMIQDIEDGIERAIAYHWPTNSSLEKGTLFEDHSENGASFK